MPNITILRQNTNTRIRNPPFPKKTLYFWRKKIVRRKGGGGVVVAKYFKGSISHFFSWYSFVLVNNKKIVFISVILEFYRCKFKCIFNDWRKTFPWVTQVSYLFVFAQLLYKIKSTRLLTLQIRKRLFKKLVTSVINSQMSPPSLILTTHLYLVMMILKTRVLVRMRR